MARKSSNTLLSTGKDGGDSGFQPSGLWVGAVFPQNPVPLRTPSDSVYYKTQHEVNIGIRVRDSPLHVRNLDVKSKMEMW